MTALAKFEPGGRQIDLIANAINAMSESDLDRLNAWQPLADLSSRTRFETVDADPASIVIDNSGVFEAEASVYVTLVYGPSNDEESMSDEYILTVAGTLLDDEASIERAAVDTSSFYG